MSRLHECRPVALEAYISLALLGAGAFVKQAAWLLSLVESVGAGIMYDAGKQVTSTW